MRDEREIGAGRLWRLDASSLTRVCQWKFKCSPALRLVCGGPRALEELDGLLERLVRKISIRPLRRRLLDELLPEFHGVKERRGDEDDAVPPTRRVGLRYLRSISEFRPPQRNACYPLTLLVLSISSSEEVEGRRLLLPEQPQPARPLQQPVPLRVVDLIVLCQHVRAQVGVLAIVEGLRGRDARCRAPLGLTSITAPRTG